MARHVRFVLDDAATAELAALRARLSGHGIAVPADPPSVIAAAAAAIPVPALDALEAEVRLLALPSIWLATLGTVAGRPDELVLAAVVDAELLAVHSAVHDALASRVTSPVAAYLPGTWLPHCVLATERPAEAFERLHPVPTVRARVVGVAADPAPPEPRSRSRATPRRRR